MSSRNVLPLLALALALGGCRSRAWESFSSATTPHDQSAVTWKGDPYTFGGIGNATGGRDARSSYSQGANPNATAPLDPLYDQPAKGTGLHPGEPTVENRAGFGKTNAPALQPAPGTVGASTVRSAR